MLVESVRRATRRVAVALNAAFIIQIARAVLRRSAPERVGGSPGISCPNPRRGHDASPPYVKGRLSRELRGFVGELKEAELAPANLSLLEGVEL